MLKLLRSRQTIVSGLVVLILVIISLQPHQTAQAYGVVGTGTPGSCTEAALETALSTGGLVTFNCGTAPHTIILTSFKIISIDTEIQGGNLITLSGANATSLFEVNETLTLRDITLTRGLGAFGTIRNFGTLNLIGSQITYGYSPSNGGAIQNSGEAHLTDAVLAHNNAQNAAGALFNNWGKVTIENSQLYSNTGQSSAGAIYNDFGTLQIHNSQIYDNQSQGCASNSRGGGIQNSGTLTVTQSIIADNQATHGGGIDNLGTLFLDEVTLSGNRTYSACYGSGGGMMNEAQATVQNTTFNGNYGAAYGGGLSNQSNSQLTIRDATFTQNQALSGGAISNSGTLTLNNSTVYTNTAGYSGGIGNGIAGGTPNILVLTNVTISDNSSTSGAGGLQSDNGFATANYTTIMDNRGESGIGYLGGVLSFKNSIIANNATKNCEGGITSQGFNISSDYSCNFNKSGDQNNTDPLLGVLKNNGGPTLTYLPQVDSPAIDGGQCTSGVETDQRGEARPYGAACDKGAVEFQASDAVWWVFLPVLSR